MRFRTIHDWCMWISSSIHVAYEVTFSKKYQKWSNNNNQILHFDRQIKITNWKKKSKCHDRTPCVLMYDLWCPEFTVRNDAVSYRISLMSNQKAYANRQQTPTVSMNALDHNFVIEKVTNIITARHIISMRELFLFSLSLSFCYHYCKYGENLILSISLWLLLQPKKTL